jgi:hypothetical protein
MKYWLLRIEIVAKFPKELVVAFGDAGVSDLISTIECGSEVSQKPGRTAWKQATELLELLLKHGELLAQGVQFPS